MKERVTGASHQKTQLYTIKYNSLVTVYDSRESAETAIRMIARLGIDTQNLSIDVMHPTVTRLKADAPQARRPQQSERPD